MVIFTGTSQLFKDQGSRVQSLNPFGFKDFFLSFAGNLLRATPGPDLFCNA